MASMTYSHRHSSERGAISALQVAVIGLSVLVIGLGSFGIWAFVAYNDASSNLDGKIAVAVAQAKDEKGNQDEAKFAEREKQPAKTFKAPDDYCGLSFQYPKTWSVFESEQITNGGDFKAYLNPDVVPAISNSQQFALRVTIEQKDYDSVTNQYDGLVQKSDLKQSSTASQGNQGMRLTGNFSKNIRGDAVIYRCRDKTITVRTDTLTFKTDFETIIRTITFNA
jgi:hypothetical protein